MPGDRPQPTFSEVWAKVERIYACRRKQPDLRRRVVRMVALEATFMEPQPSRSRLRHPHGVTVLRRGASQGDG
jgi:hypothetical protein